MELVEVPVDRLELGMYVAELDRPWLETPFLFQGFEVDSDDTLASVRRYCQHVYVDPVRSSSHAARDTRKTTSAPRIITRPRGKRPPQPQIERVDESHRRSAVRELSAMREELPGARRAYETGQQVLSDVLERMRQGKRINVEQVHKSLDLMIESIARNEDAMSWITRMKQKNDYVYEHSIASAVWAMILGKQLGFDGDDLRVLAMGTMFMDVGKTKLNDQLLVKPQLSESEMSTVRRHVEYGVDIVRAMPGVDSRLLSIVSHHHERHDGSGYPYGLAGSDIPIFAHLAGVIDTYDAMTQSRPYADAASTFDAMQELHKLAGSWFSRQVVEQFVAALGVFPVGTLVELSTGEVGVVIAQNKLRRLTPKLMLLLDEHKKFLNQFQIIDLRDRAARGERRYIARGLPPGAYGLDPSELFI